MQTVKGWLSFADQVQLLQSHGMNFRDEQQAARELEQIGYYRLSGYFYPFRQHLPAGGRSDDFVSGTDFQHVIDLYYFDNAIKLLALEATQHIEIAMRVQIAYTLGKQNPIAHTDAQHFHAKFDHADWLGKYRQLVEKSKKEDFVQHHLQKYGDLPIWAACEIWDFGAMSKLFSGLLPNYKTDIAQKFKLTPVQLESHLRTLNFIRNVAAHHSRLWNKHVINRPKLDLQGKQWGILNPNEVFAAFCLIQRMLQIICRQSDWGMHFQAALTTFPTQNPAPNEVSLEKFGIRQGINLNRWNLWR